MIHGNAWDEKQGGHNHKEREIDIRPCNCGSIHLTFFGRTTFHLSRHEFIEFSRGVARVMNDLNQEGREDGISFLQNNGLSH